MMENASDEVNGAREWTMFERFYDAICAAQPLLDNYVNYML